MIVEDGDVSFVMISNVNRDLQLFFECNFIKNENAKNYVWDCKEIFNMTKQIYISKKNPVQLTLYIFFFDMKN